MKKYLSILIITGSSLLAGCSKFMDRQPLSDIKPEVYFKNEKELSIYLNSLYSAFPSAEGIYNEDIDNIVKSSLGDNITGKRTVPLSGGNWSWTELRKINFFLENYNRYLPDAQVKKYAAVAKVFRAYFYFDKVQRFGDVPWYSKTIDQKDESMLTKARDKRTLIVDSILNDIDYAIANMDATASTENVTKFTALALKSRICLFEGTFRKYHPEMSLAGWEDLLRKSAAASEELMNSNK